MNEIHTLFAQLIHDDTLIRAVFSGQRKKSLPYKKVIFRPVLLQEQLHYQAEYHEINKVRHVNMTKDETLAAAVLLLTEDFKQAAIFSAEADYQILAAKPERPRIVKSPPTRKPEALSHNQAKNYIIPDGTPCDFLVKLGVMNEGGQVLKKHYAKFRQINRFLEIVDDAADSLPKDKALTVIDFGCGKAYLTFALYYYLRLQKGLTVNLVGLDLKEDVIRFCNDTAQALHYDGLQFQMGDIAEYRGATKADMVVTLHACDTATDFALINAAAWGASIILSVPCCQHELFDQIQSAPLQQMLKHGILKERMSAILTDSLRALKLEACGYDVSLIEFTSLEHTAKNIMIRAIKNGKPEPAAEDEFKKLCEFWNVRPTIANLKHTISKLK